MNAPKISKVDLVMDNYSRGKTESKKKSKTKDKKKNISLSISESYLEKIDEIRDGRAVSKIINYAIAAYLGDSEDALYIKVGKEKMDAIKEKSAAKGISVNEYVDRIVNKEIAE